MPIRDINKSGRRKFLLKNGFFILSYPEEDCTLFSDNNGNGDKDGEEGNLDAVMTIYKKSGSDWPFYKSIIIDKSGSYPLSILENGEKYTKESLLPEKLKGKKYFKN